MTVKVPLSIIFIIICALCYFVEIFYYDCASLPIDILILVFCLMSLNYYLAFSMEPRGSQDNIVLLFSNRCLCFFSLLTNSGFVIAPDSKDFLSRYNLKIQFKSKADLKVVCFPFFIGTWLFLSAIILYAYFWVYYFIAV